MYNYALRNSDITLSPRGTAPECFRTFEALELGSIPLVSNEVTSKCKVRVTAGKENMAPPYRILKMYKAPVIYVDNWEQDIDAIMHDFRRLTDKQVAAWRCKMFTWYTDFKLQLKQKFVDDIKRLFV